MLNISNLSFDTDEETLASIMGKVCFIILKKNFIYIKYTFMKVTGEKFGKRGEKTKVLAYFSPNAMKCQSIFA